MTKFKVTLKALRASGACISGYNRLACDLTGKEFESGRRTYIHCQHEDPIPIEFILGANGLDDSLWSLRAVPNADRDCRLFAVWCARQAQHLMTDSRSIAALDVAERHADGLATDAELFAAWTAARGAALAAACGAARDAAWAAALAAAWDAARDAAWAAALAAAWAAALATGLAAARDAQADMLRLMCQGKSPWQR